MGGVEAALILALQVAISRDMHWPTPFMAVMAAVLLALGVLRHYWDIWIHRTVRGISFIFVGIDAAGDLFSLLSIRKSALSILQCAMRYLTCNAKFSNLSLISLG